MSYSTKLARVQRVEIIEQKLNPIFEFIAFAHGDVSKIANTDVNMTMT